MINPFADVNMKQVRQFNQKLKEEFFPELQRRLDADPKNRGGKIIFAGSSPTGNGIDVQIEDKDGVVSTFWIDPINQTFCPVFEMR